MRYRYRTYTVYRLDEGVGRERYGAFPYGGQLAEDSAAKTQKENQLNVCTVYGVPYSPPPPPVAETCARLAGNFCQYRYLTTVKSGANGMVMVWYGYFTVSDSYPAFFLLIATTSNKNF